MKEKFVWLPEIRGGKLIPEDMLKVGQTYYVGLENSGRIGTYKIEVESSVGHGKFETTGVGLDRETIEALSTAFNYFKANKKSISSNINTETMITCYTYKTYKGQVHRKIFHLLLMVQCVVVP